MIDNNSIRVSSSNQYLSSAATRTTGMDSPANGELFFGDSLDTVAWLEQPLSMADLLKGSQSSSFVF